MKTQQVTSNKFPFENWFYICKIIFQFHVSPIWFFFYFDEKMSHFYHLHVISYWHVHTLLFLNNPLPVYILLNFWNMKFLQKFYMRVCRRSSTYIFIKVYNLLFLHLLPFSLFSSCFFFSFFIIKFQFQFFLIHKLYQIYFS